MDGLLHLVTEANLRSRGDRCHDQAQRAKVALSGQCVTKSCKLETQYILLNWNS